MNTKPILLMLNVLCILIIPVLVFCQVSFRASNSQIFYSGGERDTAFLLVNDSDKAIEGNVSVSVTNGKADIPKSRLTVAAKGYAIVPIHYSIDKISPDTKITCSFAGEKSVVNIISGIDLTQLTWKRLFDDSHDRTAGDFTLNADLSQWEEIKVPGMWSNPGNAWCRTDVIIPESFKGTQLCLEIGTIDDDDTTYFNGVQIGSTGGWDKKREYKIPSELIKYGKENALTIAVYNNPGSGGGIVQFPVVIKAVGDKSDTVFKYPDIKRPKAGKIGNPLPVRPIHADNGILRYPDGDEVALWGTNYYPMSWYQYVSMKSIGVDMKKTIDEDLDHIKAMGMDIVRVHIFDREMSDSKGNLVANEHLDLLDYMFAGCVKRNLYMFITTVAWWSSPVALEDSFSSLYTKPEMQFNQGAKDAQATFIKAVLNHVNPYSGTAYKDEKSVAVFEIINEPFYFTYADLFNSSYTAQGEKPENIEKARLLFVKLWENWLAEYNLKPSSEYFPFFMYTLQRDYITQMVDAIKSTGAQQPIAVNFGFSQSDNALVDAIADSDVDAVTNSAYPGQLGHNVDGINLMPHYADNGFLEFPTYSYVKDGRLDKKARVFYEFDNDGSSNGAYMYPTMAAAFRNSEVQIACQFQYDSVANASYNPDWGVHYLNYLYTPAKSLSFMLAGEAFKSLPRAVKPQIIDGNEMIAGNMASSFIKNMSIYSDKDKYMYSRSAIGWNPTPVSVFETPKYITGTGSSQFVNYGGTGIYQFKIIDENTAELVINPDVIQMGHCINTGKAPVAVLENNTQLFKLNYPGWESAVMTRNGNVVEKIDAGWVVIPGNYVIKR